MGEVMKYLKMLVLFAGFFLIGVTVVRADDKKWMDEGELSFVKTGGNSDVSTFSFKNLLKYKFSEKFYGSWKGSALNSKSGGVRSAERYASELRGDYALNTRFYAGVTIGWFEDKFAGIDNRYYLGPVVGYRFIMGPKYFLKSEVGLDYVREEYTDKTDSDFLRGRAFTEYEHHFTDTNKFVQSAEYLYDFDNSNNYNMNSVTAVVTVLSDHFSLKTSYEVKYDNEPVPATLDKTDTILGAALIMTF